MQFDIRPTRSNESAPSLSLLVRRYEKYCIAGVILLCIVIGVWFCSAPVNFPKNALITIPAGASAQTFASELKGHHIIRSALLFRGVAHLTGFDHDLDTGVYAFARPESLPVVLWRIKRGEHGIAPIRATITEGMTRFDIADMLQTEVPGFDKEAFLAESSTSEGYLFPETYFFMPGDSASVIVERLKAQFGSSTESIAPQIAASGHSKQDIVIMASILEREAKTPEDMRIISGILWKRITLGMPLQVDAAFGYLHQQNGYTPTPADLQSDSPYNTYTHQGLPPTPISNPGLTALLAAAQPEQTKYLYYVTGSDGKMHYAATFAQHKENVATYLK